MTIRSRLASSIFLAGLAVTVATTDTACSAAIAGDDADPSPTGTAASAILNGTPVTNDTLGSPTLCTFNGTACVTSECSGTMVADRWLLTAHHCVTTTYVQTGGTAMPPGGLAVWMPGAANSALNVAVYLHPTLDVALVELDSSVLNAAGKVVTTPLYSGASTSLLGKTLYCQGIGQNTLNAGQGTLRSANLVVASASVGSLTLDPNASGQALYAGDSGAGCFLLSPNQLVSVHSEHDSNGLGVTDDREVGVDGFYAWATGILPKACGAPPNCCPGCRQVGVDHLRCICLGNL